MSIVYFMAQQTMYFTIPLLIVAIGGLFSERSGIANVALEGIMVFGAFCGIYSLSHIQNSIHSQLALLLALLIGGISGLIFSALHAIASVSLKADQVICGTALNIFAPAFAIYIARSVQTISHIGFRDEYIIKKVPFLGSIPIIGDFLFTNCYITTFIGFAVLAASYVVLYKTRYGLRLRACGEHPAAADSLGVDVYKMRYSGVLASGFLAGMGGVIYVVPTSTSFDAEVGGYGFLALAVLIFGQWKPMRILLASLFFGLMKTLASAYSTIPLLAAIGLPSGFYKMAPYIATIIALVFTSKKSQAPKAVGTPYERGQK
ncbi:MAG: ABC transporter permease [Eubacteriaceae bacterium]|nr:ABC transporter permease [Eubacteriaceae bacterium]